MSKRLKNFDYRSHYIFITIVCHKRRDFFISKTARVIFRRCLRIAKSKYDFRVAIFLIQSDHIHLLIFAKDQVSQIIAFLKARFSAYFYRSSKKRIGKIWQKSFYDHVIRNELDFKEKHEYIAQNKEKHFYENAAE